MKKLAFGAILILFVVYAANCFSNSYENPYAGRYISSDGTVLKLESNNRCDITTNLYKDAFYADGKYTVKDNKINISFDKDKAAYYGIKCLNGNFEGSRLNIYDIFNKRYYAYLKE